MRLRQVLFSKILIHNYNFQANGKPSKKAKKTSSAKASSSKKKKASASDDEDDDLPEGVHIELNSHVNLTFSLKYLVNFAKSSSLSKKVQLMMSNDVPLLVSLNLPLHLSSVSVL